MKIQVKTLAAADAGEIELSDAVFGKEPRLDILHRVVTWQLEKRRGTARGARERSDVQRTGKKLGNQKGGGVARHGNRAAPQFTGGGKAHGPRVRDFNPGLNKKIRTLGLATALSVKASEGKLMIIEDFALTEAKTKSMIAILAGLGVTNGLFIDGTEVNLDFRMASANVPHIDVLPAMGANVYDILNHDTLVLTRAAVTALEARVNG
ncbi:50S ribosomal protein L4 [Polymorphobacter glacialis]|uniref:Large ribosomal subunit protein uL4 n=1 Tax=Sandarakinorhabdus glacialis TaxID=1614636 RepID=A0A916ZZA3_9SPHN|nr:50S ribosomal protein L4 [Polymorphobacter glacialis]GGE17860.1 50S ribosomal protein L4 [Polymorphobacter glacialis]